MILNVSLPTKVELEMLRKEYVDQFVEITFKDPYNRQTVRGKVLVVDDMGQLHGTWGSLAAIPGVDIITIIKD